MKPLRFAAIIRGQKLIKTTEAQKLAAVRPLIEMYKYNWVFGRFDRLYRCFHSRLCKQDRLEGDQTKFFNLPSISLKENKEQNQTRTRSRRKNRILKEIRRRQRRNRMKSRIKIRMKTRIRSRCMIRSRCLGRCRGKGGN